MLSSAITPVLPPELLESILDEVGYSNDTQTLRACALVCSTFVHRSQSHLFRAVDLDKRIPRCQYYLRFHNLLVSNPHIGTYVRYFRLGDDSEDDYGRARGRRGIGGSSWIAHAKTLPQTLGLLPRLEGFSLTFNSEMTDWNDIPAKTRVALEHVFSLPSLRGVSLEFITFFPPKLLSSFARLKYLGLSCVETVFTYPPDPQYTIYDLHLESIFLRGTPPSTISTISESLIFFCHPSVQKLSITPTFEPGFCETINDLIKSPVASSLTTFEWLPSVHFSSSIGPIDLSPLHNLRSLKFVVSFRRTQHSPFCQVLRLLGQLTFQPNLVEQITLECYFLRLPRHTNPKDIAAPQREGRSPSANLTPTEWHAVDKLLSKSAYRNLKEVKIELAPNLLVGEDEHVQPVFQRLLPGLSKRGVSVLVRVESRKDERFLLEGFGQ
ncbi:hypothetical protein CPB84DRAFT_1783809 [Gymnopilus junonius]|uniref:F-box domain-containing protein n=1 Tax=Gymnopilus junonius TaxID=109634 RepID=A0A9P5NJF1_GYMJU|nr:hypothetical protein CPB84DRAFT_1783809 [Gymnopilus junonius]